MLVLDPGHERKYFVCSLNLTVSCGAGRQEVLTKRGGWLGALQKDRVPVSKAGTTQTQDK